MTRTPDAHFYTEARYRGTKSVVIAPDYVEVAKFADLWLHPQQGTDSALALAMAHVILREFYLDRQVPYFQDYAVQYTDLPFLVLLEPTEGGQKPGRLLRAADLADDRYQTTQADWKPLVWDKVQACAVMPCGSAGFRWEKEGKWTLEPFDAVTGEPLTPALSLMGGGEKAIVLFPYFGGDGRFGLNEAPPVHARTVPVQSVILKTGEKVQCATVFDLMVAHYGLSSDPTEWPDYESNVPGTPAWQEAITGVPQERCLAVARGFARNAEATQGRSMVILGAGLNHWYNMDMTYRAILNMLILCGCIGQNGGGWAHYVGQEKLRPSAGWGPVAFAGDWSGPPRRMNGTSFFYAHTDQWRYEQMTPQAQLSPLASAVKWPRTVLDCNIQAERMGWLPSAPQLGVNPLSLGKAARESGQDPAAYVKEALLSGRVRLACEDPDAQENWPRNMFVWRSNLLGASGKGHEYFMKHLLGAPNNVMNQDGEQRPEFAQWHEQAPEGKLDLLTTIDFRMSTTAMFSDVVLPTATWYEKTDLNTSDMHTFIHPLQAAVDPAWEARTDWSIFRGLAEAFQSLVQGHLAEETDVVLSPLQKDTPAELAQPYGGQGGHTDEAEPKVPGKTMPQIAVVSRRYDEVYDRYITLGPSLEKNGNADHGLHWDTTVELQELKQTHPSVSIKYPDNSSLFQDRDAVDTVLMLAPETNGAVSARSWKSLSEKTGRDLSHRLGGREGDRVTFSDIVTQPRQVINSPVWSGISSTQEAYTANWLNVHEYVPWRTLTGRLQFYQDHPWLRDFGETFATYKPPVETYSTPESLGAAHDNGNPVLPLNFLTPHQKWGIHSSYAENLIMLTLGRGGPVVWISEDDASKLNIVDNDWVEAFNRNGTLVARAVVSQRIPSGAAFMYHAAERTANVPGSEITGRRAGIHNSVTRVVMKPTHMVGGYAHLSWSFNYYGPVGSNRDEFIFLRKMNKVDWFDTREERQG